MIQDTYQNVYERTAGEGWLPESYNSVPGLLYFGKDILDLVHRCDNDGIPEPITHEVCSVYVKQLRAVAEIDEASENISRLERAGSLSGYDYNDEAIHAVLGLCHNKREQAIERFLCQYAYTSNARQEPVFNTAYLQLDGIYRRFRSLWYNIDPARLDRPPAQIACADFAQLIEKYLLPKSDIGFLTFIRHYGTESTLLGRLPHPDETLTPEENARAENDATELKKLCDGGYSEYDGIICSTLARAIESALIYAAALGISKVTIEPGLDERKYNEEWVGRYYEEFGAIAGEGDMLVTASGSRHIIDLQGMEPPLALIERGRLVGELLAARYKGKHMLVFTHASLLRTIIPGLDPMYKQGFADMIQTPNNLVPGERVGLIYPSMLTRRLERKGIDLSKYSIDHDHPIWGTPGERDLRGIYAHTIQKADFVREQQLTNALDHFAYIPPFTAIATVHAKHSSLHDNFGEMTIEVFDTMRGGKSPQICSIGKGFGRDFDIKINPVYHSRLPGVREMLPPPPSNDWEETPYYHWIDHGQERIKGHLATFPPELRHFIDTIASILHQELT